VSPDPLERATLTADQHRLLAALAASPLAGTFYLTGGTALAAFYLHHRVSDDLDLFSEDEVPLTVVESFLAGVHVRAL
jgi:predicted nucleotidyltransferase component of viral defense system